VLVLGAAVTRRGKKGKKGLTRARMYDMVGRQSRGENLLETFNMPRWAKDRAENQGLPVRGSVTREFLGQLLEKHGRDVMLKRARAVNIGGGRLGALPVA